MGDDIEAGKYLFLSGVRDKEYLDAINKYLKRFKNTSIADLHSNFPRSIRRIQLEELPPVVFECLREKGFKDQQISDALEEKSATESGWDDKYIFLGGCLLFFIVTLVIFGIGLKTVFSWLI